MKLIIDVARIKAYFAPMFRQTSIHWQAREFLNESSDADFSEYDGRVKHRLVQIMEQREVNV